MSIGEAVITFEEYEAFLDENPDGLYELIRGRIVEKLPTQEHGHIVLRVGGRLQMFAEDHGLGRAYTEARYRPEDSTQNDRMPDISYVADPNAPVTRQGAAPGMPDFVVEVQSPRDSIRDMREKAEYYLEQGVQLVWIIYPAKKMVEVYEVAGSIDIYQPGDTLDAGAVVPGFTLAVDVIFAGL